MTNKQLVLAFGLLLLGCSWHREPAELDLPQVQFGVPVSRAYASSLVQMYDAQAIMDTDWFTQRAGGRTIYSTDVPVGRLTHGTGQVYGHATWVIYFSPQTNTVNIKRDKTHITTTWAGQTCHVYEDGMCTCNGQNWRICGPLPAYTAILVDCARNARINATGYLELEGFNVTNNP